ncbi:hypothetical protein F4809DRAFT_186741 [Biscogniauxia mediterranea]|nr:hypothetical protein F4809DRAFT_186741 [Biscogniauxia mediterranea]
MTTTNLAYLGPFFLFFFSCGCSGLNLTSGVRFRGFFLLIYIYPYISYIYSNADVLLHHRYVLFLLFSFYCLAFSELSSAFFSLFFFFLSLERYLGDGELGEQRVESGDR